MAISSSITIGPSEKGPRPRALLLLFPRNLPPGSITSVCVRIHQGTTERDRREIDSGAMVAIFRSDGAEFIFLALPKEENCDFIGRKSRTQRQPRKRRLVMVTLGWISTKASFAQSVAKIINSYGIDVPRVETPDRRNRSRAAKKIENPGHEIAQRERRFRVLGVVIKANHRARGREGLSRREAAFVRVFDGFDAGDQDKSDVEIGQLATLEIRRCPPLVNPSSAVSVIITGSGPQPEYACEWRQ